MEVRSASKTCCLSPWVSAMTRKYRLWSGLLYNRLGTALYLLRRNSINNERLDRKAPDSRQGITQMIHYGTVGCWNWNQEIVKPRWNWPCTTGHDYWNGSRDQCVGKEYTKRKACLPPPTFSYTEAEFQPTPTLYRSQYLLQICASWTTGS